MGFYMSIKEWYDKEMLDRVSLITEKPVNDLIKVREVCQGKIFCNSILFDANFYDWTEFDSRYSNADRFEFAYRVSSNLKYRYLCFINYLDNAFEQLLPDEYTDFLDEYDEDSSDEFIDIAFQNDYSIDFIRAYSGDTFLGYISMEVTQILAVFLDIIKSKKVDSFHLGA